MTHSNHNPHAKHMDSTALIVKNAQVAVASPAQMKKRIAHLFENQQGKELTALFVSEQDVRESSRQVYTRTLTQFFKWTELSGLYIDTLLQADINAYKDYLLSKGLSKLSVGSYLVSVRKFYEWLNGKGIYQNIARGVKTPPRKNAYRKQHLTEEKSSALLNYFKDNRKDEAHASHPISDEVLARDFAIVNLILRTGLRTIEVVRADIGDITFKRDKRVLKVFGKGRSDKEDDFVVLSEKSYAPIQDYLKKYRKNAKAGDPLFTSTSRQNAGKRLTTRTISGICKEGLCSSQVNLDGREYTAHSLRHTTAVAILKQGGTINEVQAVLRHASIDTSRIYTQSIEEEMRLQNPFEYRLDGYFH